MLGRFARHDFRLECTLNQIQTNQWDQVFINGDFVTLDPQIDAQWGLLRQGALALSRGDIVWRGKSSDLPPLDESVEVVDLAGQLVSPGIVDCHTHLVFGGSRATEWQRRLEGVSYREIAEQGGGHPVDRCRYSGGE